LFCAFTFVAIGLLHIHSVAPDFTGRRFWGLLCLGLFLLSIGATFTWLACESIMTL
jgi:hypothetical protein